ncbi:MAG: ABC transporter ATP-binding protein [Chloroflexota bacterium]
MTGIGGPGAGASSPGGPGSTIPAVELTGAVKRYGDAIALDHVDLRIERGEFFCLLGPSGCGKTTTLNLIGGFIPLSEGTLRIDGKVVNDLPPHKRNVNTVFQNYALFPHMTVAQNVAFGLKMDGRPDAEVRDRTARYLSLVGLDGYGGRYPQQLSGGQQQRVALARALIKEPAVLLLDEPLGALDLKLRKQMQLELKRIHRQVRTTFVFVTHDQEEALSLATNIAVMNGGRVIQEGPPREIYYQPVDRFVADFIGETNVLEGTIEVDAADGGAGSPAAFVAADGTRLLAPPTALRGPAALLIRPEAVSAGAEAPADPALAMLRGQLVGVAFLGSVTRATVQTAAGQVVAAIPNNHRSDSSALEGSLEQEVSVWWSPSDAVVTEQR